MQERRVPIRSVRATTSISSRRCQFQPKPDMDGAMLSFIEEMKAMRRVDANDPFADPTNQDAIFVKNLYHHLGQVPTLRKMDVKIAIFNYA
ncbi:hypothetical protein AB205_0196640, partial [Aquarana catesbeiana]